VTYLLCFAAAALLTHFIKKAALRFSLLDQPNARSSHLTSTPKGGGLAILIVFYAALSYLFYIGHLENTLYYALMCSLPVAAVSFLDDLKELSADIRVIVQVISSTAALFMLGGVSSMDFGLFELHGVWLNIVALGTIVWLTNLFNFLDGLDGYAAGETIFVGIGAWLLFGFEPGLLLAAATAGFLLFNWHKASIFMGDVGSATLGFIFAVCALHSASGPELIGWMVLLSLFGFDATVTLWRRWRNGEQVTHAHKKHAYQRLHQSGFSHAQVVLCGMGINLILLLMLFFVPLEHHLPVLLCTVLLLWLTMKLVDRRKAFE